jgi:hypothetical protein
MFWWWDQLDRQDAYRHYRPLAAFLTDISFVGLQPLKATASSDQNQLLGYQSDNVAYFWIFDKQATWWNQVLDKKQPTPISGETVEVRGLRPGNYRIEWWDTQEGRTIRAEQVSRGQEALQIQVPSFSGDIACKIRP